MVAAAAPRAGAGRDVVIEAVDLKRHYEIRRGLLRGHATVRAVDGISFVLEAGRTLAIVGESGSGKSTLARVVTLIEPPSGGTLKLMGREPFSGDATARRELRRAVQMVFQDPYGSLNPRRKVGAILEEPLIINTAMKAAERRDRALAMLAAVNLRPEHYNRYPHMFSGGQRQRIAIARALMLNPRLVVADEPVSALDISIQAQVLNLMMDLQEQFNLAYLFISHDLSVVRHIANEVLVMYLGRPVEHGPKETLFAAPRHPYTMALLAATPRVDPDQRIDPQIVKGELPSPLNPPKGCAFHTRCPFAQDRCKAEVPALRPVDGRLAACHFAEEIAG
ncbi:MAG: ABC transporter ATP-binding protein [Alphaproteobacteria bacterium]|nr:ABC transporter ATP-binding protein [Alphaproteobacteria bacterium]